MGEFEISGFYDGSNNVQFVKYYRGAHMVHYAGKRDGDVISGQWTIDGGNNGAFQLSEHRKRQWEGYYQQYGVKHPMTFAYLEFECGGKISGEGTDEVGKFTISGLLQPTGQVQFIKQYLGMHAVYYNGFRTYNVISGNWSLGPTGTSSGDSFELTRNDHC